MGYIKAVAPLTDCRLMMEMEGGSSAVVDLSVKLHTMKYRDLSDEALFQSAVTDGDCVIWGGGRVVVTAKELMEVVLFGASVGQM